MMEMLKSFWTDESGQGLTEYALIIALVSIALILVLLYFRNAIGATFDRIRAGLNDSPGNYVPGKG